MSDLCSSTFKTPAQRADPIHVTKAGDPPARPPSPVDGSDREGSATVRLAHGPRLGRWLATLSLTVTAFVGSAIMAPSAMASPAGDLTAATNSARAAAGLPALAFNGQLSAVAQAWANQLAVAGVLSHNGSLRAQVTGWSVLGENVGLAADITAVQAAFMASAAHRNNILDSRYTQMGVGSATSIYPSCSCQVLWVVVDFRRPTSVPAVSTPAPKPAAVPVQPAAAPPKAAAQPATAPRPAVKPAQTAASVVPASASATASAAAATDPSGTASAAALSVQLAASASPSAAGTAANPVGRMLNFATVVSHIAS
jgi:uncharacterized protein YkwD